MPRVYGLSGSATDGPGWIDLPDEPDAGGGAIGSYADPSGLGSYMSSQMVAPQPQPSWAQPARQPAQSAWAQPAWAQPTWAQPAQKSASLGSQLGDVAGATPDWAKGAIDPSQQYKPPAEIGRAHV